MGGARESGARWARTEGNAAALSLREGREERVRVGRRGPGEAGGGTHNVGGADDAGRDRLREPGGGGVVWSQDQSPFPRPCEMRDRERRKGAHGGREPLAYACAYKVLHRGAKSCKLFLRM